MNVKIKMQFDPEIAKELGVDCAIMYSNIEFGVEHNKANNTNFNDGYYWTYNSTSAFMTLFPFWTEKQIRRILSTLENSGYIKSGNYNQHKYDRTKWYTSIRPNGQMEIPKQSNGSTEMVEPIPDNKPNYKPDNKPNNMAIAKNNVQDDIDKLFYETVKDLKLPVKNHTNLKTKIKELKTTLGDESAIMYLTWLKNNWLLVDGEFKPSLNDGIDIWTKHAQIRNWLKSLQKSQTTKKGVTL